MPKAISLSVSTLKNCVRGFWNTLPALSAMRYIGRAEIFSPSTSTRPVSSPAKNCGMSPFTSRVSVVFPQPLLPHSSTNCPSGMVRLMFFNPPQASPG